MKRSSISYCLVIPFILMSTLPAMADTVTLTDGRQFRGIHLKKVRQGYVFTIENGKTVFIKQDNFAGHKKSPTGEHVIFRGKKTTLRSKILTLQKEHKEAQKRQFKAVHTWAAGGGKAESARSQLTGLSDQERELLFGKVLAKGKTAAARKLATQQLTGFRTPHVKRCLISALMADKSPAVRASSLQGLKSMNDPHAGEQFIPFLLSRNKVYRARASVALQSFPTYRAVPALITSITKIWTDGQRSFFYHGAQRAFIKDYELVSGGTSWTLTEVADPIVDFAETGIVLDAKIAKTEIHIHLKTLERITRQNYGLNGALWLQWWRTTGKALAMKREKVADSGGSATPANSTTTPAVKQG